MKVRKFRLLRHKYNISRQELGTICGLSPQRISEVELEDAVMRKETVEKLLYGLYEIAEQRRESALDLLTDLACHEESLFEGVEETEYEL